MLTVAVAVLLIALAILNWTLLVAPIDVSLGVSRVRTPLGLLLLGVAALLSVVFAGTLLKMQLGALSAAHKHAADLRRQREIAESAEQSRITELRQYLQQELEALGQAQRAAEQRLHEEITASANTLAAGIGEIDERLDRHWGVSPERKE